MKKQSYSTLVQNFPDGAIIPYQDLLNTDEWSERRKPILERDWHMCQVCCKEETVYVPSLGGLIHFQRIYETTTIWFKNGDEDDFKEITYL